MSREFNDVKFPSKKLADRLDGYGGLALVRNATASDYLYLPFCEYPAPQIESEGDRQEFHRILSRPRLLAATANP